MTKCRVIAYNVCNIFSKEDIMKVSKKILSLVLAFVCAVSVVAVAAPTQVYAAKTKEE